MYLNLFYSNTHHMEDNASAVGFLTRDEKIPYDSNVPAHTPDSFLRSMAAERAVIECYTALFKSILRHGGDHPALAHLSDATREELQKYYVTEEKRQMDYRFVTIHPGQAMFFPVFTEFKKRILTKCYVGDNAYCIEGKGTENPHIHVLFRKTTDVLDKSRIIREWSAVLQIPKTCIDVRTVGNGVNHLLAIRDYMVKEGTYELSGSIPGFKEADHKFIESAKSTKKIRKIKKLQ